jgi:hypothetical protein
MMTDLLLIIPRALFYGEWIVIGLGVAAIALLILIVIIAEKGE